MNKVKTVSLAIGLLLLVFVAGIIIWFSSNKPAPKDYYTGAAIEGTESKEIISNFQRVDTVKVYNDLYQLWSALSYGKIDVAIADRLKSLAVGKSGPYRNLKPIGTLFEQEERRATFRAGDNSLRRMFNRGFTEIINNGLYTDISKQYFGQDIINGMEVKEIYPNEPEATDDSWIQARKKGTIVFAFNVMNPPYSYLNKHNKLEGFEVELAQTISAQLGIKHFTAVSAPENQVFWELSNKKYDGVFGFDNTKANDSQFKFSNTYCVTGLQLFVRKSSEITSPEVLGPPVYPEPPPLQSL